MGRRIAPTHDQIIEILTVWHEDNGSSIDTHAAPFEEFRRYFQREVVTTKANARKWLWEASVGDDMPLMWLVFHGPGNPCRYIPNPNPTRGASIGDRYQLDVLRVPDYHRSVIDALALDSDGTAYTNTDPDSYAPRPLHIHWIATPAAVRHMLHLTKLAEVTRRAGRKAARQAEQDAIEAAHGPALDLLRGLLTAAGLDVSRTLNPRSMELGGNLVHLVSLELRDGAEIDKLADVIRQTDINPVTRDQVPAR